MALDGCDKETHISEQETVYRTFNATPANFGGNISSENFMILSHMLNSTMNAK